jgi:hypothetical protein
MTSYVSAHLRRKIESRANNLCEYCLIHEDDTFLGCQVDHIIAEKHGGTTESSNLSYACTFCNQAKGSDVGSVVGGSDEFTRFFNPRADSWIDHFVLESVLIQALTPVGEATANILGFNKEERILERAILSSVGRYPSAQALAHISPYDQ